MEHIQHPIKAGIDLLSVVAAISSLTWLPPAIGILASVTSISWVCYSFYKEFK